MQRIKNQTEKLREDTENAENLEGSTDAEKNKQGHGIN